MINHTNRKRTLPARILSLLLLCLLCLPGNAQKQLRSLIDRAQTELDFYQPKQALSIILEGESLLKTDTADAVDYYCIMAICLGKNQEITRAKNYLQKALSQPLPAYVSARAHLKFAQAYLFHLEKKTELAIKGYQAAYDLYSQLPAPWPANAGRACVNPAVIFYFQANYDQALKQCNTYQAALELNIGPDHLITAHLYHTKALALVEQRRFPEAEEYYKLALAVRNAKLGPEHIETLGTVISYAVVENALGDYESAEQDLMFALNPVLKSRDPNAANMLAKLYANLGTSFLMRADFHQSIYYNKKALEIEEAGNDVFQVAITLYNIGTAYREQLQHDTALMYYQRALNLASPDHPNRFDILSGMGLVYERKKDFDKAESMYREALRLNKDHFNSTEATSAFNLGRLFAAKGDYDKALEINRSAQRLIGYYGDGSYDQVTDILSICETLYQECILLWEINARHESQESLQRVRTACINTIGAFNMHARTMRQASGRQTMKEHLYPVLEIALLTNQRLKTATGDPKYWKESFDIVEQAKVLSLYEALLKDAALQTIIPETERQKVYEFRRGIDDAQTDFQNKSSRGLTDQEAAALRQQISIKQRESDKFWDQLEDTYHGITPEKSVLATVNVDTVQRMLKPNQAFLEYFVGDSSIFLFRVQKDSFRVIKLIKGSLDKEIGTIRNAMEAPQSDNFRKEYTESANKLYLQLIPENLEYELIIAPDGLLYLLPFEALLTSPLPGPLPKYNLYPFMIRKHCISYTYSATILGVMSKGSGRPTSKREVLGMAPFFEDNKVMFTEENSRGLASQQDTFTGLVNSGAELNAIKKYWPGEYYYKDDASIERFKERAPQFSIIHLSTHGVADNKKTDAAFIAFAVSGKKATYNKLYTYNLANIPLAADLVTLSACQSAMGRQQISEGVFSLARSCTQAGAKSVVTTLWSINDLASNKIMTLFYYNLFLGEKKDEALRKAKLEFMSDNSFRRFEAASPGLWAAFIPIGNMERIEKK